MDRVLQTLARARAWVAEEPRVRAAHVHGSFVQDTVTPLSYLDLIVIAEPGRRESIWRNRVALTTRLSSAGE